MRACVDTGLYDCLYINIKQGAARCPTNLLRNRDLGLVGKLRQVGESASDFTLLWYDGGRRRFRMMGYAETLSFAASNCVELEPECIFRDDGRASHDNVNADSRRTHSRPYDGDC